MSEIYTLCFGDEAPRVGSGYRKVEAVVGYKWVKIKTYNAIVPQNYTRISRKKWNEIVAMTERRINRTNMAVKFFEENGRYPKKSLDI